MFKAGTGGAICSNGFSLDENGDNVLSPVTGVEGCGENSFEGGSANLFSFFYSLRRLAWFS